MLCIIAAMAEEIEALSKRVEIKARKALPCGREICEAGAFGKSFLIVVTGIGKVNAAATFQYALDNYQIDAAVNIGTAGGIEEGAKKSDIFVAEAAYQHDYDLGSVGGEGYRRGDVPNIDRKFFRFDKALTDKLISVCEAKGLRPGKGLAVSGDRFIDDIATVKKLRDEFGASVCEMEAAALIQTAVLNGFKRLAAVKVVSDGADANAAADFSDLSKAKEEIAEIILALLEATRL